MRRFTLASVKIPLNLPPIVPPGEIYLDCLDELTHLVFFIREMEMDWHYALSLTHLKLGIES